MAAAVAGRTDGASGRAADDRLSLVPEFIRLPPKIFFQGEWHGFGGVREQSYAEACGRGHTQNIP